MKCWADPVTGPQCKYYPDGHVDFTIPSGKSFIIRSTGTQLESLSDTGVHTVAAGAKYESKIAWSAGALSIDGTNCATANRLEEVLNGGPKKWTLRCADNAASVIYGSSPGSMPVGWDEGTIQLCIEIWHPTAESITFAGDFQCQCKGDGDLPNNTWSGLDANSDADILITAANAYKKQCSAALTCTGTCAAQDVIDWKYTIDAATSSPNISNTRIVSAQLIYTRESRDDF